MKKFYKGLVLIIFILSSLFATEITVDEIMNRLAGQRDKINSYSADVVTTMKGAFIPAKKVQNAKIYFQAPDNLRTDISDPQTNVILKTGNKSYRIDHDGNSKEIAQDEKVVIEELKDPLKLFDKFNFTISEINNETLKLVGIPKSNRDDEPFSKKIISKIVFYIDKEGFYSKEIRVHKADGLELARILTSYQKINGINFPFKTETIISFSGKQMTISVLLTNIILNQSLSDNIFDLELIKQKLKAKG